MLEEFNCKDNKKIAKCKEIAIYFLCKVKKVPLLRLRCRKKGGG
jgi:hypothetical protein